MTDTIQCAAYRVNEQKVCPDCGLCWDHDDPDPPQCRPRSKSRALQRVPPLRRKPDTSFWRRNLRK